MVIFENILIPVEKSNSASKAAAKAIELFESSSCTLHLVKVMGIKSFFSRHSFLLPFGKSKPENGNMGMGALELEQLQKKITEKNKNYRIVSSVFVNTGMASGLRRYFEKEKIDLVLASMEATGHDKPLFDNKLFLNLARNRSIPLLTVFNEPNSNTHKPVLVPIMGNLPKDKLLMALAISKVCNVTIHLISFLDNSKPDLKDQMDNFYYSYKLLSDMGHPPHYKIFRGKQSTNLLMEYANQVKASMIFTTPENHQGWLFKIRQKLSEWLSPLTRFQILTIKPYRNTTLSGIADNSRIPVWKEAGTGL